MHSHHAIFICLLENAWSLISPSPRLNRGRETKDELLKIEREEGNLLRARVKEYSIEIDRRRKTIRHDCDDWERQSRNKNFCKHMGKLFLFLDEKTSLLFLEDIAKNRKDWAFLCGDE